MSGVAANINNNSNNNNKEIKVVPSNTHFIRTIRSGEMAKCGFFYTTCLQFVSIIPHTFYGDDVLRIFYDEKRKKTTKLAFIYILFYSIDPLCVYIYISFLFSSLLQVASHMYSQFLYTQSNMGWYDVQDWGKNSTVFHEINTL